MEYENFREVLKEKEFFTKWDIADKLTEEIKKTVYNKYIVKCKVFQRDEFVCQNIECKFPDNALTMHHVRWRKNGGKDAERNCITLCTACHSGYHKSKRKLIFANRETLPNHMRGKTYEYYKEQDIDWKKVRTEMKIIRKNLRHLWNNEITEEQWICLMTYLFMPYDDEW